MGSNSSLLVNPSESYILGLWCADRYLRTSSIGLSNCDLTLIERFLKFLLSRFTSDRIRIRIHGEKDSDEFKEYKKTYSIPSKNASKAYHVYVNSRSLVREFLYCMQNRNQISKEALYAYFAGRFDGDGCISRGSKRFCRISYGNYNDASLDRSLLIEIKTSLYMYKKAGTFCLYFSEKTLDAFLRLISPYSTKLQITPYRLIPKREK